MSHTNRRKGFFRNTTKNHILHRIAKLTSFMMIKEAFLQLCLPQRNYPEWKPSFNLPSAKVVPFWAPPIGNADMHCISLYLIMSNDSI